MIPYANYDGECGSTPAENFEFAIAISLPPKTPSHFTPFQSSHARKGAERA
jgi:hypothetical protein